MFEYIGGDIPGKVFAAMPASSEMVCVGNLSHVNVSINSGDILFNSKTVRGFLLFKWVVTLTPAEKDDVY